MSSKTLSTTQFEILLDEPIGTINPNIYGHFIEHLGACVQQGVWVGANSRIPNINGIRKDVIEALRAIGAPVIRWPGGCFADDYHWQDGIGPKASRPRTFNLHWGGVEDNHFGTHEFIEFCRLVGAEPYLAGNVGSSPPREIRDWFEYCNVPSGTTLADQRIQNGAQDPFNVKYWGVGNENWGCGGNMHPEEYAAEYRRYSTYLMGKWPVDPYLIACGPSSNDLDWTERFFEKYHGCRCKSGPEVLKLHGYAIHHYSWSQDVATTFDEEGWYQLLDRGYMADQIIADQRAAIDRVDPDRKIDLILDEWGTWHRPTEGRPALWQQNTVRDAVLCGITFDILNKHADKVAMANIAQTVNVLQALLLTEGDQLIKTPTYHLFDLYQDHKGGASARLETNAETLVGKLPTVCGSASVKEGVLTVTMVNPSMTDGAEVNVKVRGGGLSEAVELCTLAHSGDVHAYNSVENPDGVALKQLAVPLIQNDSIRLELAAASITKLRVKLGV